MNFKKKTYDIIKSESKNSLSGKLFDVFIVTVIILNLFIAFFNTFNEFIKYINVLKTIELITMIIFAVEYIIRIWTTEYLYEDKTIINTRFSYVFSFFGIVDLLTFLPYFLPNQLNHLKE